jgi:hypothetical protein
MLGAEFLSTDRIKQLIQLNNRLVQLAYSLRRRSGSERNRDLATRYNILRADVKRVVNDPHFDRTVPPVWCFEPLHISSALLVPLLVVLLGVGLAYFLLESNVFDIVLLITSSMLVMVLGVGFFVLIEVPASTIEQVQDRTKMLHQYLEDYIALNPDLASRIRPKDEQRLERQFENLQSYNLELRKQLAEFRRRESVYLSIIKAQTSATYSLPPKSREILFKSLQRQYTTLMRNLTRLQEAKAQYGLNVPLDILNAIDQTQQDLKQIEATIADLKANKTETN